MFSFAILISTLAVVSAQRQTHVVYSKPLPLYPGQVTNDFHEIAIPQRPNGIAIHSFKAQVVEKDENGKFISVRTSDAYLHHHLVGSNFRHNKYLEDHFVPMKPKRIFYPIGFGAGTETRLTVQKFPDPFAFVTHPEESNLLANIHIINTRTMPESVAGKCLECPCTSEDVKDYEKYTLNGNTFHDCAPVLLADNNTCCTLKSYHGGLKCCEDHEFCLEQSYLEKEFERKQSIFYMEFTMGYSEAKEDMKQLYLTSCCDATGDLKNHGNIEYDIRACDKQDKTDCVHTLITKQNLGSIVPYPFFPPEKKPKHKVKSDRELEIAYMVGHQHRGGLGIELYNDETDELICRSTPIYGKGNTPGDEKGYIVKMTDCTFENGLRMRANHTLRIVAKYNNSMAHTGVMSLFYIAGADEHASEVGKQYCENMREIETQHRHHTRSKVIAVGVGGLCCAVLVFGMLVLKYHKSNSNNNDDENNEIRQPLINN